MAGVAGCGCDSRQAGELQRWEVRGGRVSRRVSVGGGSRGRIAAGGSRRAN